jgi:AraC-like DNA-binding protein
MENTFSNYIHFEDFTFKHARGVSDRSGKEFHIYHEIIYFLGGEAEFISENLHMQLSSGTLIVIPRETYHQMIIHGEQARYHRCLLQFTDNPELAGLTNRNPERIMAIVGDEEVRYLFEKLIASCDRPEAEAALLLKSVLTILLCSLQNKKELTSRENYQTDFIRRATNYINQNLDKKILISEIAAECNVSVSTLTHLFKKEMNIPIHKFIIKKRLINAYHKISAGEPATPAALECGFNDYSGFYRQYVKSFGFPPSRK